MSNFLKNLKYSYGRNECVKDLLLNEFSNASPSEVNELQENIVNYILNDELINKYETSVKYKKKFLKTLINAIENEAYEEVNPVIFDKYIEMINTKIDNPSSTTNYYYRIYYSKVYI